MDDDSDGVPDTRVFVSGLPLKYTSEQLGAHFAGRYQITDSVVIPGRQIGFVGFRNYTLAKNAVKYFDKTYIRMSKISVSMAKPAEVGRADQGQAAAIAQHETSKLTNTVPDSNTRLRKYSEAFTPYVPLTQTSAKRKRDETESGQARQGEALREFMSVMQPAKKAAWAGDDFRAGLEPESKIVQEKKKKHKQSVIEAVEFPEDASKHKKKSSERKHPENETVLSSDVAANANSDEREERRKRKKGKRSREELASESTDPLPRSDEYENGAVAATKKAKAKAKAKAKKSLKNHDNAKGGVKPLDEDAFGIEKDETDFPQPNDTKSDSDWLRARTSRTLDLVGPNETTKAPQPLDEDESSGGEDAADDSLNEEVVSLDTLGETIVVSNGRLFVRNLPFTTVEDDLENTFSRYGKVAEVHVVRDFKTSQSKGVAYLQFVEPQCAEAALRKLDGKSFQGRLLHILPASDKKSSKLDEFELSKLPLKTQKLLKRKAEASASHFSWNSLYMNPDAVLSSVAHRLGIDKAEVLDPTSSDAGVKQAFAETSIIQKTKDHLRESGVDVEAFKSKERDDRTLLLKNFVYGTTSEELRSLLEPFGQITKFILPPSGTMGIVQFREKHAASHALKQLAYKNLKGSPLFLEKGPRGLFKATSASDILGQSDKSANAPVTSVLDSREPSQTQAEASSSTVFVRNLNFSTTTKDLTELFSPLDGFLSAKVKTRTDPKRPGEILSMGFGFVEFASKSHAQTAIATMVGYRLDGHELQIQASHKTLDAGEEQRREDKQKKFEGQKTKIIIKNLPFEASKKDIQSLFGAYGKLRSIRLPKKFDNSTRGFAFAEFVTAKEAQNALETLANTHLLGRRLVLDFAEGDTIDPEEEIAAIEKKVWRQTRMVDLNKLTGSGRRKFNVDAREDVDTF